MRPERPGRRDEAGFTVVEAVVASSILLVALAVTFTVLTTINTAVARTDLRSQTTNQVRQAIEQIDRQVRSGNVFYDPALEPNDPTHSLAPGLTMRIYTQANGLQRCAQWRINGGILQMRTWSPSWVDDRVVSGWTNVAEHIVNTTSTPAFALDPSAGFGGRLLKIDIIANVQSAAVPNVEVAESVAGRNTTYGYPTSVCGNIPPYT